MLSRVVRVTGSSHLKALFKALVYGACALAARRLLPGEGFGAPLCPQPADDEVRLEANGPGHSLGDGGITVVLAHARPGRVPPLVNVLRCARTRIALRITPCILILSDCLHNHHVP